MPNTLTHSPHAMSFDRPLSLARGKRGLSLVLAILAAALIAGWAATLWLAPAPGAPQRTAGLDRRAIEQLDLSTFQKKGSVLVGETTTPSGARLRLVIDARTHELVGLRVIDAPEARAR